MPIHFTYRPAKRKTCEASHWSMAVFIIIGILSGIGLIVLGFLVAKPGILALKLKDATCMVKRWRFASRMSCDCSGIHSDNPYCTSKFPCYQITVAFEPWRSVIPVNNTENSFKNTAMIHESETDFSGLHSVCSFRTCNQDYQQNRLDVDNFMKKYGQIGSFYLCKYNPEDLTQVVIMTRFNKTSILLSLIIPAAVFVMCLLGIAAVCVIRYCVKKRKTPYPADGGRELEQSYMSYDMPAFEPDEAVESNIQNTTAQAEEPNSHNATELTFGNDVTESTLTDDVTEANFNNDKKTTISSDETLQYNDVMEGTLVNDVTDSANKSDIRETITNVSAKPRENGTDLSNDTTNDNALENRISDN